jgi:hypothetical protein
MSRLQQQQKYPYDAEGTTATTTKKFEDRKKASVSDMAEILELSE